MAHSWEKEKIVRNRQIWSESIFFGILDINRRLAVTWGVLPQEKLPSLGNNSDVCGVATDLSTIPGCQLSSDLDKKQSLFPGLEEEEGAEPFQSFIPKE